MKVLDYASEGVYTVTEIHDDDPVPKGIMVNDLDLIVTRAFLDKWSRHFAMEDEVRSAQQ